MACWLNEVASAFVIFLTKNIYIYLYIKDFVKGKPWFICNMHTYNELFSRQKKILKHQN